MSKVPRFTRYALALTEVTKSNELHFTQRCLYIQMRELQSYSKTA